MPSRLKGTILVVDDEESLRTLLQAALGASGAEVLCAADAGEAVELLQRRREDVRAVLLDLNLKDLPGERLYDRLAALSPDLAVFPMSGCCEEEVRERLGGRPIAGVVSKPFAISQLVEALASPLEAARLDSASGQRV